MSLTFRIYRGTQLLREETLGQQVIKIGKVSSAHLRLEDESISRMHAIIERQGGEVSLIDLGSTRGTFVNGQRINKAMLANGDVITLGDLRIEVAMAAAAPVVVPKPAVVPPPVPVAAKPAPMQALPPAEMFEGAKSIEVAAMLGDSVVDVKHCIDPTTGRVSSKTYGMFAAGAACVLASAISFGSSVHTASQNQHAFETWTRVEKKPAGSFRAELPSQGYDWVAFGGFAIGIGALAGALSRMRAEKQSPTYRIGTAPGVDMALEQAPAADFALVAPKGDDFVLNLGHGLSAEMMTNGQLVPVSASELPINAGAKFRVRSGQTTFMVSAVARPRRQAAPLLASLESRTLGYFAGSLAVHIGLWALLQTIPEEQGAATIELGTQEPISMKGIDVDHEKTPDMPDPQSGDSGGNDSGTVSMRDPEGKAGSEKSLNTVSSKNKIAHVNESPQAARDNAIEEAREAGILGDASMIHNGFNVSIEGISSGWDDVSQYGDVYGADTEGYGHFGVGRKGFGLGGGCDHEPCGTIP
ncbi:MAG: FHA domain-containing protein, partial [Deltaproteobacteria bacterium]|nr:FHA domain-containing protein [Deltaproteobacteria bacterium]